MKNKKLIIGLCSFFLFFVLSISRTNLLFNIRAFGANDFFYNFLSVLSLFSILLIFIFLFKEQLINDFHFLKKNHRYLFKTYLPYWFVALGLMAIANLTLYFFVTKDLSDNEQLVRQLFQTNPIIIYISAVIVAPILEELVFRGSFYYIFKNKFLFIFFSGILFGLIHVSGATSISQFLYVIPYSIPGFVFAYALYKSKNFFVPIGLHFIHNGVLVSLQMVVYVFGGDLI